MRVGMRRRATGRGKNKDAYASAPPKHTLLSAQQPPPHTPLSVHPLQSSGTGKSEILGDLWGAGR